MALQSQIPLERQKFTGWEGRFTVLIVGASLRGRPAFAATNIYLGLAVCRPGAPTEGRPYNENGQTALPNLRILECGLVLVLVRIS
jgi:hypothetical protein